MIPYKPFLFITTDESEQKEIRSPNSVDLISPTSICEVDGCYHTVTNDKICKEHHTYASLNYLIAHKTIQTPVTSSKYNFEQRGLSYIHIHK